MTGIMRGVSEQGLLEIEFDKKIRRFKHKEIDIRLILSRKLGIW